MKDHMKIDFDSKDIKWVEVPGAPVLNTFEVALQMNYREKAFPTEFLDFYGLPGTTLVKVVNIASMRGTLLGSVPIDEPTYVTLLGEIRSSHRSGYRVVAVSKSLTEVMRPLVHACRNMELPAP